MFTDEHRCEVWNDIRQHGMRAFAKQITPGVIIEAARRTGARLVKSPLCLGNLVWLAIAAALHRGKDFAAILTMVMVLLEDQQGFYATKLGQQRKNAKRRKRPKKKHSPQGKDPTRVTEEAFAQARQRMPLEFWVNLIVVLGELFEQQHRESLTFRGFRLLAMDGSIIDLPHWPKLREHFGTARNQRAGRKVQGRMVMLQFPLVRLPYCYEFAPLKTGEVTAARRLVGRLRKNDLVLLDAGFWSYGLLWDIQSRGAFFAIRLKGDIKLNRVRRLGRDDQRMRWTPNDSRRRWKREGWPPSIDLRVITYQVPGFRAQKLVTNVLSPHRIPRQDWVRLTTECENKGKFTPGLYHRRWEIETTYRELKVDQGMKEALRSRTPESIQYEIAGHVVLYLLVRWLIVEAAVRHGIDPLRVSFAHALRELLTIHDSLVIAEPDWARVLLTRLLERIAEHQVPFRPGRHYPRRKKSTNHKRKSEQTTTPRHAQPQSTQRQATKSKNKTSDLLTLRRNE
ncbi:MAG: IS4 family transposase [Chloroflexota bacterium]